MPARIELSGQERFAASPEAVYRAVTDLDRLAMNMPDVESVERVDEDTVRFVVRPGFSFVRGKVNLTVHVSDRQPFQAASMSTHMQGIGQQMRAESVVQLSDVEGGTQLDWQVRVIELKGLLSAVSPGLIKGAAEKIIHSSWDKLRQDLEGSSTGESGSN